MKRRITFRLVAEPEETKKLPTGGTFQEPRAILRLQPLYDPMVHDHAGSEQQGEEHEKGNDRGG